MKNRHLELAVTLFLTILSYAMAQEALIAPQPEDIQFSLPSVSAVVDYVGQSTAGDMLTPY